MRPGIRDQVRMDIAKELDRTIRERARAMRSPDSVSWATVSD